MSGFLSAGIVGGPDIPDSGDLQVRYDSRELSLSDGNSLSTWADATGNGHDLTQATESKQPTYQTGQVGSLPAVLFDGSDDLMTVSFSDVAQPTTFAALVKYETSPSTWAYIFDGVQDSRQAVFKVDGADDYRVSATSEGDGIDGGSFSTNATIIFVVYDGANSIFRQDGTQVASGDVGSEALGGVTLAGKFDDRQYSNISIVETLVYQTDKSSIASDIESYLDRDTTVL